MKKIFSKICLLAIGLCSSISAFSQTVDIGIDSILAPSNIYYCPGSGFKQSYMFTNYGNTDITDVTFRTTINGNFTQYAWSGGVTPGNSFTIEANVTSSFGVGNYHLSVFAAFINGSAQDANAANNTKAVDFEVLPATTSADFYMRTDMYGSQTTWSITDANNRVIIAGGPYEDGALNIITKQICMVPGCYTFHLYDSNGDGIQSNGGMNLKDSYTHQLYAEMTNNIFGSSADFSFCTNGFNGINETESKGINISPNPATNQLNISTGGTPAEAVRIYSTTGQLMLEIKQPLKNTMDISALSTGVYVAEIKTKQASVMYRWVKM